MPAYNFKERFADDVEKGIKRQTIRPVRKNPTKPGDELYLYTGQRTKKCRKLLETFCKSVDKLSIFTNKVIINDKCMSSYEICELSKNDGFENVRDFFEFFKNQYGLPCRNMRLIRW